MSVKPTVYIETSVISYRVTRLSRDLIVAAHQQLTHKWWERVLPQCDAFVSPVVLEEIAQGAPDAAQRRLQSIASFPALEVVPEVDAWLLLILPPFRCQTRPRPMPIAGGEPRQ